MAAGLITRKAAFAIGSLLLLASVTAGWLSLGGVFAGVVGSYLIVTVFYSIWLKHIAVLDLGAVAAGFVLRGVAGGVAADVPLSDWFLIVAMFGSLFMVTGKREAELRILGEAAGGHRAILDEYPVAFLHHVRSVASAVTIAGYCLWAFEKGDAARLPVLFQISIVPFVLAVLRYGLLLDTGHGGAPEDVVFSDRVLRALGLLWILICSFGVYAGLR